ncbi:hypothetical protein [Roseibacillus persicicus]|uniref:hypothetical protein n=1 Tax=Roseibacillus persicicus TaxID=454148 RepID=UPI00280F2C83|nr:hypothetical protein [Roseibacillus persicicus]MDQ8189329.1 hypothetical protein [Roseibacillus persicicus]
MKTLRPLLFFLLALPVIAQECLDFENFTSGTIFSGSQESISFNTTFLAQPNQLPGGGSTSGGSVSVGQSISALNSGQALNVNNAAVQICLPGLKEVSFRFSNQGGYFNFSIDGSSVAIPANEPGSLSVKGVDIVITGTMPNNRLTGEITLTAQDGTFECFSVGGQELQIDDICFLTCENPSSPDSAIPEIHCVEFEDLDKQGPFPIESSYVENEITFKIRERDRAFGQATSSTLRQAGHLGKEFHFQDSGFNVGSDCWSAVKFHFYTKEQVEVTVNGITTIASSISALDGQMIGDAMVVIQDNPTNSGQGIACFLGRIEDFAITGKDFYLDHFCVADCLQDCIDFEGENVGTKYVKGDTINEDGFELSIANPQSIDTPAQISTDNHALGSGNELFLNAGEINFGKVCFNGLAFQYGQFTDNFTLSIGGAQAVGNRLSELDGQTIGDMTVEVFVTQAHGDWERGVIRLNGAANEIALYAEGLYLDRVCIEECPEPLVVGFGEEPLGEVYENGDTFGEDNTTFTVCDFRINDEGSATITGDNQTGGTGQAIDLDFASLKFDLLCASRLSFQFANFGANGGPQGFGLDVRMVINGISSGNVQNFTELNDTSLGGAYISVVSSGNSGTVTITGDLERVIIGGFNIQLDNLMQTPFTGGPQCHNFNTWDPSLTYGIFNEDLIYHDDGTAMAFLYFITVDDQYLDGTATISNTQSAGGSGQELTLLNSTAYITELYGDWSDVSFRFRDLGLASGRQALLTVNSETYSYDLITDLDGQVFHAGTDAEVTASVVSEVRDGKIVGIVKLDGIVNQIAIGGQGLVIDDICGTRQPAPILIDSQIVSVERTAPGEFTYIWDVEALNVQDSDFFVGRSTDLSSFSRFYDHNVTVQSLGNDRYRVTETQPIDVEKRFYKVYLRSF